MPAGRETGDGMTEEQSLDALRRIEEMLSRVERLIERQSAEIVALKARVSHLGTALADASAMNVLRDGGLFTERS